jgi:hypothetical protein
MKKNTLFLLVVLLVFGLNQTYAQVNINKLGKTVPTTTAVNSKSLQTAALNSLDLQLKKKYNLAFVKSELIGDSLAINIADNKLNAMGSSALNTMAGNVLESAVKILKAGNVKTGIKTVAVNLLKNIKLKDVLTRVSKKL